MQGNRAHRPPGHRTRGIHKKVRMVAGALPGQSQRAGNKGWSQRVCPKCGRKIWIRRFVTQKEFHEHVAAHKEASHAE